MDTGISPLQRLAQEYTELGWEIRSMTDEQLVVARKKELGLVFWIGVIVGLFIFIVPGLIIAAMWADGLRTTTVVRMRRSWTHWDP